MLGCLGVLVASFAVIEVPVFRRTLLSSSAVGTVFALQNVRVIEAERAPQPAAAVLTAVFGAWFVTAPLLYQDPGVAGTAVSQAGGLIVGAFGAYVAIESLT